MSLSQHHVNQFSLSPNKAILCMEAGCTASFSPYTRQASLTPQNSVVLKFESVGCFPRFSARRKIGLHLLNLARRLSPLPPPRERRLLPSL